MATEWMDNLLGGKIEKEAMVSQGTDAADHFERKVVAHPWVNEVLELDADKIDAEYQAKLAEEAKLLGKTAAYEMGETPKETVKKDYERDVKILSDYALAEMLAEARGHKAQNTSEMFYELKEKAKAEVASSREKAEKALLDTIPENTQLDWQKAFERFSKEAKPEEPKEKDLFPKVEEKDVKFDKPSEDKFKMPTKEEMVPAGNGREADERTDVTKQSVPVIKEAALSQEELMREMTHVKQDLAKDPEKKHEEIEKFKQELYVPEKVADEAIQPIKKDELYDQATCEGCPICGGKGEELPVKDQADHLACSACGIRYSHTDPKACMANQEIKSCASKADVLKKVAEIQSPWTVEKLADGTEAIVRREIVSTEEKKDLNKESEEKKDDEIQEASSLSNEIARADNDDIHKVAAGNWGECGTCGHDLDKHSKPDFKCGECHKDCKTKKKAANLICPKCKKPTGRLNSIECLNCGYRGQEEEFTNKDFSPTKPLWSTKVAAPSDLNPLQDHEDKKKVDSPVEEPASDFTPENIMDIPEDEEIQK